MKSVGGSPKGTRPNTSTVVRFGNIKTAVNSARLNITCLVPCEVRETITKGRRADAQRIGYIHTYIQAYIHTYIQTGRHTYTHTYIHTYI